MAVVLDEVRMNSLVKYRSKEGFQNLFSIPFEIPVSATIQVSIGFNIQSPNTDYTVVSINSLPAVQLVKDVPIGEYITIRRVTESGGVPHTYSYTGNAKGGAEFNAQTIDENFQYISSIVEEISDENQSTAEDLYNYQQEISEGVLNLTRRVEEAEGVSSEAVDTANNALSIVGGVEGKADQALLNSTESLSIATEARTVALSIDAKAEQSLLIANNADANATSALNTANGIAGTANQANVKSDQALTNANQALNVAEGISTVAEQANLNANNALNTATNVQSQLEFKAGLPLTIGGETLNTSTEAGHTHSISKATTTNAGITQLTNNIDDTEDRASTPKALNTVKRKADQLPNPILERFPVGASSTTYRLVDVDEMRTLLNIPEPVDVAQTSGTSTTSAISQKAYTDLTFGINQVFKDVTSLRSASTTYTNTSNKLRVVYISMIAGSTSTKSFNFYISGMVVLMGEGTSVVMRDTIVAIIPPNMTYRLNITVMNISKWVEYDEV